MVIKNKKFFTSDTHFGCNHVLQHKNRYFKSVEEMNKVLIDNINAVVDLTDDIYFLGDFTSSVKGCKKYLKSILNKINGIKHLILGNHDNLSPWDYIDVGFFSVHTSLIVPLTNLNVRLIHDPALAKDKLDMVHLCGHVHNTFEEVGNCINVGVDVREFKPVSEIDLIYLLPIMERSSNIDPWY